MPYVVHADEDAEHVGLEFEAVLIPSGGKLMNFVSGDSPVMQAELEAGIGDQQLGASHPGVAFSKGFLFVWLGILLVASGVRDGIPLKEHDATLLEDGFCILRMMGRPCLG